MKQVIFDWIIIFVLVISWSCQLKTNSDNSQQTFDRKKNGKEEMAGALAERLKSSLDTLTNQQVYKSLSTEFNKLKNRGDLEFDTDSSFIIRKVDIYGIDGGYEFYNVEGDVLPSKLKFNFLGIITESKMGEFYFRSDLSDIDILPKSYTIDDWVVVWGDVFHYNSPEANEDSVQLAFMKVSE